MANLKQPVIYERIEGAAILVASLFTYLHLQFNLVWFAVLLLAFDVSMIGYAVNPKIGAHAYNSVHSLTAPAVLLAIGLAGNNRIATQLALIWLAHIGLDRMLGYGLKFPTSFHDTHLGHIGKD